MHCNSIKSPKYSQIDSYVVHREIIIFKKEKYKFEGCNRVCNAQCPFPVLEGDNRVYSRSRHPLLLNTLPVLGMALLHSKLVQFLRISSFLQKFLPWSGLGHYRVTSGCSVCNYSIVPPLLLLIKTNSSLCSLHYNQQKS